MADYRLESRTRTGSYLCTLPARNIQGEFFKNKASQIRWTMPLKSTRKFTKDDFYPGITEVWLYRNDVLVYAGPLWNVNVSSRDNTMNCDSESLMSYFDRRRINADVTYTGTYGATAWSIIAASQAETDGALGITLGTQVPGGSPSATFAYTKNEGTYILDAITDLSDNTDGFDWEITPGRVAHFYYPRIQSQSNVRLEYGGNVTNYSVQVMGKYEANDILIKGPEKSVSQPAIDTAMRSLYGLRQYVGSLTDAKTQTILDAYGAKQLADRRAAREVPQVGVKSLLVNPFDGDINYGQIAQVIIQDGWVDFNAQMRNIGFQVSIGKSGEETFVLYMSDLREVE